MLIRLGDPRVRRCFQQFEISASKFGSLQALVDTATWHRDPPPRGFRPPWLQGATERGAVGGGARSSLKVSRNARLHGCIPRLPRPPRPKSILLNPSHPPPYTLYIPPAHSQICLNSTRIPQNSMFYCINMIFLNKHAFAMSLTGAATSNHTHCTSRILASQVFA